MSSWLSSKRYFTKYLLANNCIPVIFYELQAAGWRTQAEDDAPEGRFEKKHFASKLHIWGLQHLSVQTVFQQPSLAGALLLSLWCFFFFCNKLTCNNPGRSCYGSSEPRLTDWGRVLGFNSVYNLRKNKEETRIRLLCLFYLNTHSNILNRKPMCST